ncbi:MAG: hypothetical protein AB1644_10615 [Candidatus Zixiibacteriota bacterium]
MRFSIPLTITDFFPFFRAGFYGGIIMTTKTRTRRLGRTSLLSVLALLALLTHAQAFDGKRQGFVTGIGFGMCPMSHWAADNYPREMAEAGVGFNGFFGLAWDEQNFLTIGISGSYYNTIEASFQGLSAISWYHYWGRKKPFFTFGGVGMLSFSTGYWVGNGRGFGYTAGAGYEVVRHVQVGFYYIGGHTGANYYSDVSHSVVNLLVTVVAY